MAACFLRWVLTSSVLLCLLSPSGTAETILPTGTAPQPVTFPHFPDSVHALVWRNWDLVEPERIAKVLGTSVENVRAVAESMGLPPAIPIPAEQKTRGRFILLRRNWHLLPYDQLLVMLDISAEQLAYSLSEDDFMFIKLGRLKPKCKPMRYVPPDQQTKERAARIKRIVEETFGDEIRRQAEPRFDFIRQLSQCRPSSADRTNQDNAIFALRYIYPYVALYGDPLISSQLDPCPDGLFASLAEVGVEGIWLHVVLRNLAPGGEAFPEFGNEHQTRLANLRKLVSRAKRYDIGVYLYINEPRAMPAEFFENRPEMAGATRRGGVCICTSHPAVRRWISDSLAYVFKNVPELAGVFTITASENQTNCVSLSQRRDCPRCKQRSDAEIIAEVNATIEAGVHRSNPDAKVIVWDWAWPDGWAEEIIPKLPKSVWLMSVSEWSKPIERGGVKTQVGEYSISAVGPGPRATRHWSLARQAGLKTVAKVQLNNSCELISLPYLPVMDLVAEHCHNLATAEIDGMMLSWCFGGYPSPNLQIAHRFSRIPVPSIDEVLDNVARDRFGPDGAPHARKAWTAMSSAFRQYPYNITVLYNSPVHYGPSNLLYPTETGYAATMLGFPYDDVDRWRGPYPPEVFAAQFEKVAAGWKRGLAELQTAVEKASTDRRADARAELRYARAARLHFKSVANQTRFVLARNALADAKNPLSAAERHKRLEDINRIVQDEIAMAREMFTLARLDSRIGFEVTNQYFYFPLDFVEKVVNCRYILDHHFASDTNQ